MAVDLYCTFERMGCACDAPLSQEIDIALEQKDVPKLSASEKRIMMTHAVSAAWRKINANLDSEKLFRKLGYIWSKGGKDIRLDVLPAYKFDPMLAGPTMRVPYTPLELQEASLMLQEDSYVRQHSAVAAPKPRSLKQATLQFK